MLLGVTVALLGEYGADVLWFEDEESSMSVSELRYAVNSGKVWNDCVELDDELFLVDEGKVRVYDYQSCSIFILVR